MRIEQLEYVAAVTTHGSLRRASEALHTSQPALSEAVSKLEKELGLTLLDRRRSGSRISRDGLDLLAGMTEVLDAVDRLRAAAGDQAVRMRTLRIGTVNTASSALLAPALRDVQRRHDAAGIEVVNVQQQEIHTGLGEGTLDLGLVNALPGDDVPATLHAVELVEGRPVVCLRTDHPLAGLDEIGVADLRDEPLVAMRAGYVMHRFAHRLFGGTLPRTTYATDGAELGKAMVAEGLGVTLLPDFSVADDALVTAGVLTTRPIVGDDTAVRLLMLRRRSEQAPPQLRDLQTALVRRAAAYRAARNGGPEGAPAAEPRR
jgi:DNA-binding transcriptional LysR family regulator